MGGELGMLTPAPVSPTEARRVRKEHWELEYDREVDEMIERQQRQERERVWNEKENGNDTRGED